MNGASIRNIRRNISEAATGSRCNRFGDSRERKPGQPAAYSFKNYRKQIAAYVAGLFKQREYEKHWRKAND
jgi:hypothetical protein